MSKIVEKFVKDFKATKKRLKALSSGEGEKMKKTLITNLDKVWALEDVLQEAVQKARAGGVTSKKSGDFVKHADVVKPLKTWQESLKGHQDRLEKFNTFHRESKGLFDELTKRVAEVEKELKKTGGTGDVPTMATIKEAKRALPDLKKAQALLGTLQGPVVMYGMNTQRTIDGVVRTAIAAVTPKEYPEPLAEKNRPKTEKAVKEFSRKINDLADEAREALEGSDVTEAGTIMKKIDKHFKILKRFQKEGKTTATKMKKELKADKNSKKIQDLIKRINIAYDTADRTMNEIKAEMKQKLRES